MVAYVLYEGNLNESSRFSHSWKAGIMARNGKSEVVKTLIVVAIGAVAIFSVYGFVKLLAYFGQLPIP